MASILLLRNLRRLHSEKSVWMFTPSVSNPQSYVNHPLRSLQRFQNTNPERKVENLKTVAPMTTKEKFKKAVAEYGSTVIIFHVGISLVSLGVCYVLVSSGLDASKIVTFVGISGETASRIASNAGTFAVAYAVHKVFAPVRITITLTATPFIVRYLRNIGVLRRT